MLVLECVDSQISRYEQVLLALLATAENLGFEKDFLELGRAVPVQESLLLQDLVR